MSTIRLTIDDELYKAINAILREKDITISEAVTSYLRAVIWTNSLALDAVLNKAMPTPGVEEVGYTQIKMEVPKPRRKKAELSQMPLPTERLVTAQPEQQPARDEELRDKLVLPDLTGSLVDKFVSLICSIPDGMLSTWEEMEDLLSQRTGEEIKKPLHDDWPKTTTLSDCGEERVVAIPYWRVLSWRGSTKGEVTCSRDLRETMLKAEGHEIITTGRGLKVVRDYKKKLVKWDA